ncbi:MAG TPA: electron transfer flavoprotein subunit beta/FixA family protein [Longimicrobiales bacterium]|nr:electron transfer flavoprotein subunit beta/FixA family protein [Longimicrobiales bacterium]
MDVIVCVKRVPDTETRIRIGDGGTAIDPAGVKFIMSPYDEFAVEAALRTKESVGAGEVTLVTLGGDSGQETLRAGLAMGADKAVLLTGEVGMDGLATAKALAAELGESSAPLILFGVKAADDDQQQVGPMTATLLGRACVTGVTSFELQEGKVICHREVEGGVEVVEATLPAVVTITKGTYEPRYASLKGIMAAKKKPLEQKASAAAESRVNIQKLVYPPERAAGKIVGEGADAAPELARLLREEANVL